jgi:hypothetical protein
MTSPSAIREQKERREVLKNDRAEPTTFHQLANLDTSPGGRFSPGGYVSGSEAIVQYPPLPASSLWSGEGPQVPDEGPTNIDINAQEPTGTFAEVQRSEFANSEDYLASPFNRQMDGEANGVGDPAPAGATPVARAEPADRLASSPRLDRGSAIPSAARLAVLMAEGLVRPVVRRRKV